MRSRNIKPGFFKNEDLAELGPWARLLFAGLWCLADKEGFLEYRPKRIDAEIFPYEKAEKLPESVEKLLDSLCAKKLIRFWVDKTGNPLFIEVPSFPKHQHPHKNEKPSEIVPLLKNPEITRLNPEITRPNPADSFILIPDSKDKEDELDESPYVVVKKKKDEAFSLPDSKNSSDKKITDYIKTACQILFDQREFKNVNILCDTFKKRKINEKTIAHVLKRCIDSGKKGDLWGYCLHVANIENGNINESDFLADEKKKNKKRPESLKSIFKETKS